MEGSQKEIRLIVAGGGTGGHLFPAIAVVKEIERRFNQSKVLFIIGRAGRGQDILSRQGYQVARVDVEGLKGRGWKIMASVLFRLPKSVMQSIGHVRRFSPHVIFGVGGYSAGPVCLAGWLLGVPTAIHEQNALPGLTNRMLARFVDRVFISFDKTRDLLAGPEPIVTGTPIRPELLEARTRGEEKDGRFTILVMGGSQGAKAINQAFVEALSELTSRGKDPRVIHQTGELDYERTRADYETRGLKGEVIPFIEDMADAYGRADLVVCRAGASTLFELAALGKPAILIPYPFAANQHQDVNAQALVETGGADMLRQSELTGQRLAMLIEGAMEDRALLEKKGQAVMKLAKVDAAKVIVDRLMELISV
ncbi:MAG: undecaprenyldiphospho-muramoylpentapeptide beta-N-acetylglucosaminyltransferase [Deltaproteobacteria bacterium]|nr:undecaprenyldiphospho-muramoylpentapeptide beta-N-acetylglucosaminyltransferase [Deltaproteobacteria bacterium]MBW1929804.1 undecaprenyldiphospho-muramoylpentapeptide beta-N-acetylglucosaminyltransferase [Deltaproteobacteria bacterium]MBW2024450.1 undecaprenyldiphospho-muramoylpentapeptide beta-N-acetylglucosaminyltransferase [Deltaproteobacteria bacterium]MBW2124552.1 undecaprenyldiphospho-muramoylpentapeptide beta-N-acetylglucosaminyltransferase [Deltaproteobacteria bacterium]RLB22475.1 MA